MFLFFACDCRSLTSCFVYLVRRNTSVDESYEWDSADACVDSEVLEATRFDPSKMGFGRDRGQPRCDQAQGLQDQQQKGELCLMCDMFGVACLTRCDAMLHVFILHPRAVTVRLPRDVPHPCLFLSLRALPRPVSLSQPASFQPTSLPVQPLPKRGPLQRSAPGVPRVQAGAGIRLHP